MTDNKDWKIRFDEGIGADIKSSISSAHSEFCLEEDNCDCLTQYDTLKSFISNLLEENKKAWFQSGAKSVIDEIPDGTTLDSREIEFLKQQLKDKYGIQR